MSSSRASTNGPTGAPLSVSRSRTFSPSRLSRKFKGKAGIDNSRPHAPALPSPLSTSTTPDELAAESAWTTVVSPGSAHGKSPVALRSAGRMEFPFPSSPSTSTFSASSTATVPGSQGRQQQVVDSPPQSPRQSAERVNRDFPPSPTMTRMERGRSSSSHAISPSKSSDGQPFPPAADVDRQRSSTSLSPTRESSTRPLLTPPESVGTTSRHLLASHAELAWNDLGFGRLGVGPLGILNGLDFSHLPGMGGGPAVVTEKKEPQVVSHLMSLEANTPLMAPRALVDANANGPTTGNSSATPKEGTKRVGNEDLMGGTGGGHFGPATRDALGRVIRSHLDRVPLPEGEDTIHLVEYGALNSRSASLMTPIISSLASRHVAQRKTAGLDPTDESLSFQITHADKLSSDFRQLSQQLESHSDSYLNQHWQMTHEPTLSNQVFSSFISRPFGAKVLPKNSVSVGFSAMSLHWLSTERKYRNSPSTIAHGELMAFLSARAHEFKSGGLLAMAFICRSDEEDFNKSHPGLQSRNSCGEARSNPATPGELPSLARPLIRERSSSSPAVPTVRRRDIWAVLSGILGKAIQRLVSTQLLKPAVARQLLALPVFARTSRQTEAALKSMSHAWIIETEETMVLSHPAWRGLEHNTISPASYTDHTIQLLKIFWESELRSILREALLSRAACEWILECLFDIAREKIDEEGPQPLELEVQLVALRRR
ncbi:GPCR, family 3, metabotropic glutamate receptor 5 [Pseudohyphozyma bogoriensis]|nr:GPCR, family 3, metabotropic glutamate receptor 5 [Pseudohyphozyma bogoriensis]